MFGRFRQLLRPDATSHVNPQPELGPFDKDDELWRLGTEHVPNRLNASGAIIFRGSLTSPLPPGPPRALTDDQPPTLQVAHYGKQRAGVGLWGVEPLIPEGEVE